MVDKTISENTLKFVRTSENAFVPTKGSYLSAGFDLHSAYDYIIKPQDKIIAQTDLRIGVPPNTYGRLAPRSGLASKHFIDIGAGVIDQDYTGKVGVVMFNHSQIDFKVKRGDRIAQLICEVIVKPELEECATLEATKRGENGFGSTGMGIEIKYGN